jgi:hypothetical protein
MITFPTEAQTPPSYASWTLNQNTAMNTKTILWMKGATVVALVAVLPSCVGSVDRVEDRVDRRENRYDRRVYSGPGDHLENRIDRREGVNDKLRGRRGLFY